MGDWESKVLRIEDLQSPNLLISQSLLISSHLFLPHHLLLPIHYAQRIAAFASIPFGCHFDHQGEIDRNFQFFNR